MVALYCSRDIYLYMLVARLMKLIFPLYFPPGAKLLLRVPIDALHRGRYEVTEMISPYNSLFCTYVQIL